MWSSPADWSLKPPSPSAGVYIDTDCIVMNDVTDVRNAFGAQLTDGDTGAHKEVDGKRTFFIIQYHSDSSDLIKSSA